MADHNEKPFETELCEHLAANGWLYSENSQGYDKERALFPEDVFGWLGETQPEELAKVLKVGSRDEAKQRAQLLDRIVKVLDTPMDAGGGTLAVLRTGFKHVSARFDMCQFQPETTLNAASMARYAAVRLRVVRQVYFSTADQRSVDLVLFVNGLPAATAELKTDFTQSVTEAIEQYRTSRQPKHPVTKQVEPLFGFGKRALVHFAVSNDEVWMTTKLAGDKTHFLPFNMGCDGGAGNPPNPHSSASSYLWERVWQRDAWLNIIGRFMHVEHTTRRDPISGAVSKSAGLLFPRFHQWEVVTALSSAARTEGPGHRYLVQHSAGSGKTNSIAWTAHRLARLHDEYNQKVFDSVIVVTDRTVLDDQLQDAIRQIDSAQGVVATISDDEVRRAGAGSKSSLLAKTLLDGKLIIVVTIQTFPHAMEAIAKTKGLRKKTFAVIADEAHSSQTGATANKLRQVLTAEEIKDIEDGGEFDLQAVLAGEMTSRARAENISYFAFTATPKPKTLELFGRPDPADPEGMPIPFHLYTMKQAIEEEFILDVLRGYQTYDTAFRIAQRVKDDQGGEGREVDESAATRGLMRWVKLHPTNIGQKVQIIVEHFRANVLGLLDGHAKAMVITDSRKAAVRYKTAIDAYIVKQSYDIGTLVAFSGEIDDPETGPDKFTETSMNPDLRGRDLRTAFATDQFRIMLVANKFQTGFDQPLLCGMYIDKQLSGVAAVQTLSRLNRTYRTPAGEKKDSTYVLDFVNAADDIRAAFLPYFTDAHLETATDPNLVHDIATKLDQAAIYTPEEIDQAVEATVLRKGNNALAGAMAPAKTRFKQRYQAALIQGDKTVQDELDMFRKDVGTFVRLYDFVSQVVDYGDVDLEKRSIFLRLLERLIRPDNYTSDALDLSGVSLVHVKQIDRGQTEISLGERKGLQGVTAAGSGAKRDPKMVAFQAVIDRLNELFGDEDFTSTQQVAFLEGLLAALEQVQTLRAQAATNTQKQFLDSPDLVDGIIGAVADNQGAHNKMADYFFGESRDVRVLTNLVGAAYYERVRSGAV
ncbi:type I restriction endonuclease [Micromonospora sp. NPDC050686]|uniref:type I restriction endonuclease subunit R n=1 Tax=Micromonospora sp. NPDC050686 TaxID=3154631 RepID=UPI0033C719BF